VCVIGKKTRPPSHCRTRVGNGIWIACRIRYAPLGSVALRQRKRNGAHGQKEKQIKCPSDKMRFNSRINLLFHFGVVLGRTLSDPCVGKEWAATLIFRGGKLDLATGHVLAGRDKRCQEFFLRFS
jgi:hypothetical protein